MVIDTAPEDPRRQRVLERSADVFVSYGFQRTTMDDIARAADMSRPALYLLFRNKTDIYRAIADKFFHIAFEAAREALAREGSLEERLERMLDEAIFAMMARFQGTQHGAEILDAKTKLAGDLVKIWNEKMVGLVEEAIRLSVDRSGVDLAARGYTPRALSELFWDALDGAKARVADLESQRRATRMIVRLVTDAVAPR